MCFIIFLTLFTTNISNNNYIYVANFVKLIMYLNCHTYYSLRYGTIKPEQLLAIASENGVQTLALTDINNTSACLRFCAFIKKIQNKTCSWC